MGRHRKARATRTVLTLGGARVERSTWRGPAEGEPFLNGGVWCIAQRVPYGHVYRALTWEEQAQVAPQIEDVQRMREIDA